MKRNKNKNSYIKYIAVIDIIIKNSDEFHPISIAEIQNYLYELKYDFQIDSRMIKKFVESYNTYYEDNVIVSYHEGKMVYYYAMNPFLDIMEAKAILDLVYSSNFFTDNTKNNYKKRIQSMFSFHNQAYFQKVLQSHVTRPRTDDVFYRELETIVQAINQKKKIHFTYHKPHLKPIEAKTTEIAPIDTYYQNNEYYLLCQGNRNHLDCISYRLDYIKNVEILEDQPFSYDEYELQCFKEKLDHITYMYGDGQIEQIELDFDPSVYANMMDKFGQDIHPIETENNLYRISVRHIINHTFYSWIIGFGGKVQISGNQAQVDRFQQFLISRFLNSQKD